jgi:hypothetical protein
VGEKPKDRCFRALSSAGSAWTSLYVCRSFALRFIVLAPCLAASLHRMSARGTGAYVRSMSASGMWFAAGVGLQARWPITPWLNLLGAAELQLQAARPVITIEGVGRIAELSTAAAQLDLSTEWIL